MRTGGQARGLQGRHPLPGSPAHHVITGLQQGIHPGLSSSSIKHLHHSALFFLSPCHRHHLQPRPSIGDLSYAGCFLSSRARLDRSHYTRGLRHPPPHVAAIAPSRQGGVVPALWSRLPRQRDNLQGKKTKSALTYLGRYVPTHHPPLSYPASPQPSPLTPTAIPPRQPIASTPTRPP